MTYPALEQSRTLGAPISLVLFTYGDGASDYYGLTDHTEAVTYGGKTYLPVPVERDSYTAASTLDRSTMTLNVARDAAVGELFASWPVSTVVRVRVYEGHYGDTDYRLKWSGRVISVSRSEARVSLKLETLQTSMKRVGLRRNWQYGCPHALYSTPCGANKAAATRTALVSGVSSPFIDLPTGWNGSQSQQAYVGGIAQWVDSNGRQQIRTIMAFSVPNRLRLSGPTTDVAVGTTMTLVLGCPHTMEGCASLHNNILNFGGQPWIPTDNPIGIKNNFY